MARETTYQQTEDISIDMETGELKTQKIQRKIVTREPHYIKLYCQDIGLIGGLSPMAAKVLFMLAINANYDNEVMTAKSHREAFAEAINKSAEEGQRKTSAESIRFVIGQLCEKDFIRKKSTGLHVLNPSYFARKSFKDVIDMQRSFSLHLKYSSENGREAIVNFGD